MIRIHCPFCGERDHSEFTYGGDGSVVYPPLDGSAEAWREAVFMRENIRGRQLETWHHLSGCRQWLLVERDTMTHEIHAVRLAHDGLAHDGLAHDGLAHDGLAHDGVAAAPSGAKTARRQTTHSKTSPQAASTKTTRRKTTGPGAGK